mmetsp:Transcript_12288/g.14297  ORF Transcript_12288/g.14297 Transcript_12288/m.14297 type:complete len:442 (-) Transcript_12288:77-1402(-)
MEIPMERKPLIEDAGLFQTIVVMVFCHISVTFLCINVIFDLFIFGLPVLLLHSISILPSSLYYNLTSKIINWTTPIVYGIPMIFSGTTVYVDNAQILIEAKESNSLVLANHGSRIDWMIGMFIGHVQSLGNSAKLGKRCRVGFVCEALIQMMPIVGWYRKIICHDIFVWRSFDKDAPTIKKNIETFHDRQQDRMLFLSPEGVIVDHNDADKKYIQQCRQFCKDNGYKPFEYVLTPRYKGTTCLLDQVSGARGGPVVSICAVFVRDGKLLNCKLVSQKRIIPDIYDLNQGIAGKPISIYLHIRSIMVTKPHNSNCPFDAKACLMNEYIWKDGVIAEWEERLEQNTVDAEWISQFTQVGGEFKDIVFSHLYHVAVMIFPLITLNCIYPFLKLVVWIFCVIALTHTMGWYVNTSSMESVPFETGIKAFGSFVVTLQGKSKKKNV